MAELVVKSSFVSAIPDGADASVVRPSNWNAGMTASTGQLSPARGGTGVDGSSAANGSLLIGNGTGFSNAGITAGANVTVTPGSGSITIAASGTNSGPTFNGGIPLTGVKYPHCMGSNLNTGDNDLYTVPVGKRAAIFGGFMYDNSAGNITAFVEVKISGTYYRLGADVALTTGTANAFVNTGYIAEANEIIAVNSVTTNGLNVWLKIMEFDNSCAVKSSKLTSVTSGNQTVYTTPASTTAFLLDTQLQNNSLAANGLFVNGSGGTVNGVQWHVVASGQAVGTGYLATAATTSNNGNRSQSAISSSLSSGDYINLATTTTASNVLGWVNVMEIT